MLAEGNFEAALEAYQALLKEDANNPTVNENNLNGLGYYFINNDQVNLAHDVFKVNMLLHPDSFNVYDSYAEAAMKIGEIDLAIENYTKSVELNPDNTNAEEKLKELKKSK